MSLHRDSSCEIVSSTEKPDDILISQQVEKSVIRKLVIIIVLCAIFMALELVGGFFANSLAIICDGFHLLSDLGGFVISLISTYLSSRKATRKMNFGFRRIEILGAFSSVIFIWILTGSLLYMAVNRIILADYEIDSK
jgi:zinc transporter 2